MSSQLLLRHESCLFGGRGLLIFLCLAALGFGQEKNDFKNQPFLKDLVGEWTTEGELKGTDGNVLKIKENWKAEFLGENSLAIEGSRDINDNRASYKWTLVRNSGSGLYEATHQADTNNADTQRFEVQVPEGGSRMELTALLEDNNSKIVIIDYFEAGDRETLKTKVEVTNESGATTLSGTLTSKKAKKP